MPHILDSLPRLGAGAITAALLLGVAACGGGSDESAPTAAPVTVAVEAAPDTTTAPETTTTVVEAVVIEATGELATFAAEHGTLVADWSAQLEVFGEQAVDHLDDLSAAPASPGVREISDEVVAAIGEDATDPGLVTLRDFAATASEALGLAAGGAHAEAFAEFLSLQTQTNELTAVVDLIAS